MTNACPQAQLPEGIRSSTTLLRVVGAIIRFLALAMLFIGALLQLIGAVASVEVPADEFCKASGYTSSSDCKSKDYDAIFSNQPKINTMTACCKTDDDAGENKQWYFGTKFSSNRFFSSSDAYENMKFTFENADDDTMNWPFFATAKTAGATASDVKNNAKDFARKLTIHLFGIPKVNETGTDIMPLLISGGTCMTLYFFVMLNMTCFYRKGFALFNLYLAAFVFVLSLWALTTAQESLATTFVQNQFAMCKDFPTNLFDPASGSMNELASSQGGAALLGQYPCLDYKCFSKEYRMKNANLNEFSDYCTKSYNPAVGWSLHFMMIAAVGSIISITGGIIVAGILGNVGQLEENGSGFD